MIVADLNYVKSQIRCYRRGNLSHIKEMDYPIDSKIAEALYAAITTDTGNFQYNTSKETHLIIADYLMLVWIK